MDVVFDMGKYSWTINGNDINTDNLKDINLNVNNDLDKDLYDYLYDNIKKRLSETILTNILQSHMMEILDSKQPFH